MVHRHPVISPSLRRGEAGMLVLGRLRLQRRHRLLLLLRKLGRMLCNWVGVECLLERERIFILVGLVIFVVLWFWFEGLEKFKI